MEYNKITLHDFGRAVSNGPWGKNDVAKKLNRLYYVNGGSCTVKYAQKEFKLTLGNVYILPQAKDFHRVSAENFDHNFFDYYCAPALQFDSFTEIPGNSFGLAEFFTFINSIKLHRRDESDRIVALKFLKSILSYIERHIKLPYISDKFIVTALKLLEENPNISSKEIAEKLSINESYFIRLFSKAMGTSPMKFSQMHKMSVALYMLESGNTVSEITDKCGYSSVSAFGKAFRKAYGCSPSNYKAKK
ncbi:MAG: helix-turn-helix transcriptional regulator [Clostridia bacterium]|nr:helix-turn-helix transcriptional regulator [Clostridia bacterium]